MDPGLGGPLGDPLGVAVGPVEPQATAARARATTVARPGDGRRRRRSTRGRACPEGVRSIGGIVARAMAAGRWADSPGFRVAFLTAFPVVVECATTSVHLGPNPNGFHPPSLRAGAPIGQAPPLILCPLHWLSGATSGSAPAPAGPLLAANSPYATPEHVRHGRAGNLGRFIANRAPDVASGKDLRPDATADRVRPWPVLPPGTYGEDRRPRTSRISRAAPAHIVAAGHPASPGRPAPADVAAT